jgi:hypothetical protein
MLAGAAYLTSQEQEKTEILREDPMPLPLFSQKIPCALELNLGLHGAKLASVCLSYSMAGNPRNGQN